MLLDFYIWKNFEPQKVQFKSGKCWENKKYIRHQSNNLPKVYTIVEFHEYSQFSQHLLVVVECWKWWTFIRLPLLTFCVLVPKPLSNAFYWLFELNNRFHCYDDVDKKDCTNHHRIFQYVHINKVNEFILFYIFVKVHLKTFEQSTFFNTQDTFYNLNKHPTNFTTLAKRFKSR